MKSHSGFILYIVLVSTWSIMSGSAWNIPLLLAFSLLYAATFLVKQPPSFVFNVQPMLVVAIHAASLTHWVLPLYFLHMIELHKRFHRRSTATLLSVIFIVPYIVISAITRHGNSLPNIAFETATCLVLGFMFGSLIKSMELQKQLLDSEKKHLSTHDPLTGLYNFQEFHRQTELLVNDGKPILLILADCKDLKSLNTSTGFQGVNDILKQAAQLLRIMFPQSSLISRYGGDEFAIVIDNPHKQTLHTITQLLSMEFPKLTGIEINFGIASFPQDGKTKDDLLAVAESHLYMMKRETWLKREEHMLRSEKLRVVGELASGMAHEIRNPLTTIKGFIQLSKAERYNIEPWYELIMDEINRMSMLTAEFLQFSRPHITSYKVHSLRSCVQRVISLLESEATRLGHKLDFQPDRYELLMRMDQDKMLQLLLNLVKNALEAMEEQGTVDIKLYPVDRHAVIEIMDDGKGIPEGELDKIFIPFYTTKDSGTGLGLSICHKIVQDHEGTIEVESLVGLGTKFTITLPTVSIEPLQLQEASEDKATISI
ncbi:ATP-binding protein [Paenibacillus sp. YYML68]|uniref:ATP-binding protein n=1 Tax=Paenibacillus sp. YYML68 TaxID=2909250 RepID=UPI0024931F5F|nr:ATP-binding protein [Paenibacillus sp. YYML68]